MYENRIFKREASEFIHRKCQKPLKNKNMEFNSKKNLVIIIFFSLISIGLIRNCFKYVQLKQDYFIVYGTIYETARGQAGASLYYKVKINNKIYNGERLYGSSYLSRDYFLNKTLPVAISKIDTNNKKLLIEKSDFKEFGLERPDSLDWIGEDKF